MSIMNMMSTENVKSQYQYIIKIEHNIYKYILCRLLDVKYENRVIFSDAQ